MVSDQKKKRWVPNEIDYLVRENLLRLMDADEITQAKLATLTGWSKQTVNGYTQLTKPIGKESILKLCEALHVKPVEFYRPTKSEETLERLIWVCPVEDKRCRQLCGAFQALDKDHQDRLVNDAEDYLKLLKITPFCEKDIEIL